MNGKRIGAGLPLLIPAIYLCAVGFVARAQTQTEPPERRSNAERISTLEAREDAIAERVKALETQGLDTRLTKLEASLQQLVSMAWLVVGGVALELILHAIRIKAVTGRKDKGEGP